MEELTRNDLKAIEVSVKFLIDDITDELNSYEDLGMEDAVDTSTGVLKNLYNVLNKVRKLGMAYDTSN